MTVESVHGFRFSNVFEVKILCVYTCRWVNVFMCSWFNCHLWSRV